MKDYCPICNKVRDPKGGIIDDTEFEYLVGRCATCFEKYPPTEYPCPYGGSCNCCTDPFCSFRVKPFDYKDELIEEEVSPDE